MAVVISLLIFSITLFATSSVIIRLSVVALVLDNHHISFTDTDINIITDIICIINIVAALLHLRCCKLCTATTNNTITLTTTILVIQKLPNQAFVTVYDF